MSLLIALCVTTAVLQAPAAPSTGTVSGLVVEDGSGIPVGDAEVRLMPLRSERTPPPRMPGELRPSARTNQEGRFLIRGLSPGHYLITAHKLGYAFVPPGGATVEVSAGEERTLSLALLRGAVIVGRVVSVSSDPLVNLRVMAMQPVPPGSRSTSGSRVSVFPAGPSVQTNDLGEFRLYGLAPGDYYVQAAPGPELGRSVSPRARTLIPTYFPDTTDPAAAQVINLGAGQTSDAITIHVADAPAFQVSGVVVDETGRPVANAVVRLDSDPADGLTFPFGRFLQARTNASGAFTISNVTSATYVLVAIAPQVTSSETDSRVAGGGSVVSFGSASSGGPVRHGVMSESRDGITTYYRDETATRVSISVTQADVSGLQVVVRLPQR
jgi:hypothetical protein